MNPSPSSLPQLQENYKAGWYIFSFGLATSIGEGKPALLFLKRTKISHDFCIPPLHLPLGRKIDIKGPVQELIIVIVVDDDDNDNDVNHQTITIIRHPNHLITL